MGNLRGPGILGGIISSLLTSAYVWPGPPEPPVQCNTSLGPQRSLDLVCSPGFDGGLPQEFRAVLVNKNINKVIINKTAIIPSFSFPGE